MKRLGWIHGVVMMGLTLTGSAWADAQYTVVAGDNIGTIASKMQVPIEIVLEANPKVTDANKIYPGMTLNIPAVSPLAGGAGVPEALPEKASEEPAPPAEARGPEVVRVGVPQGLIKMAGLTWRSSPEAWDVVIPDCGQDTCSTTVTLKNVGPTTIQGLKVSFSSWYYLLKMSSDCDRPLAPGEQCDILVSHTKGYVGAAPGAVIIQAQDAFFRPPDEETIWFWDTVFWVCAVADDPHCKE